VEVAGVHKAVVIFTLDPVPLLGQFIVPLDINECVSNIFEDFFPEKFIDMMMEVFFLQKSVIIEIFPPDGPVYFLAKTRKERKVEQEPGRGERVNDDLLIAKHHL
jgi:hypothetical protein